MNICVYGASSGKIDDIYKKAGYELGFRLAKRGHDLIFGGGDSGMMGASARGTHDAGGKVTSIAPSFFNVDGILYPLCDEYIFTETMRERKHKLEDLSCGFVVSAGGIGTFEEFFEVLTLRQLARMNKPIAILNTAGYYDSMLDMMKQAVRSGFLAEQTFDLFFVSDDIDRVLDYIEDPPEISADPRYLRGLK